MRPPTRSCTYPQEGSPPLLPLGRPPLHSVFGRRLTLTLPVPGPFLTRLLNLFSKRKLPPAFFDVLYLDDELRVHRTGQNATFVQRRPAWAAASC